MMVDGQWKRWIVFGLACGLAACVAPQASRMPSADAAGDEFERIAEWEAFDQQVMARALLAETNRVRARFGLSRLREYPRLERAADLQAATTAMVGYPSHDNPIRGRRHVHDRVAATGITARMIAENVATTPLRWPSPDGPAPAERTEWPRRTYAEVAARVVQQWLDSPPHRASLLNRNFTHVAHGAALARSPLGDEMVYSVQVFIIPGLNRRS